MAAKLKMSLATEKILKQQIQRLQQQLDKRLPMQLLRLQQQQCSFASRDSTSSSASSSSSNNI
jgi:hypothetical protein